MSTMLLTIKDVQERLGISESTLFRILRRKELRGFKVGDREWRFTEADIEEYIRYRREKERAAEEAAPQAQVVVVVDAAAQDIAERLSLIKGKPTKKQYYTIVRDGLLRRDIKISGVSASVAYVQEEQKES